MNLSCQIMPIAATVITLHSGVWLSSAGAQPEGPVAGARAYTAIEAEGVNDASLGSDPAQAERLFFEAKQLRDEGKIQAACQTLQRSLALNPALGTLLNLGRCHRELGKIVSAHDYYRRAEVLATLTGDTVRGEVAHDEAARLTALRATLWLQIANTPPHEIEVRIDDVPQPLEVWSHPMFVDAGEHVVSIRAPEHDPFRDRVRIQDGDRAVLVVPDLQRLPSSALATAAPPPRPSSLVSPELVALHQSSPHDSRGEIMRVAAIGLGTAGIASLAIGLVFGQLAKNANDDSKPLCDETCTTEGVVLRDRAFAHATRSTVLSIAGGVALASGVSLWLLGPSSEARASPRMAFRLSSQEMSAQMRGRF